MSVKLQRVDRLKEPPVVGHFYLVPLVHGKWFGIIRDWPVIGLKHDDIEFLDFEVSHYHVDTRFLRVRSTLLPMAPTSPLHEQIVKWGGKEPLRKPFWRRRKCLREQHIFRGPELGMRKLEDGFTGRQCAKGKRGFVCPHKQFPLGSTPAIDGMITCPLHGLRVDAKTGVVVGASKY